MFVLTQKHTTDGPGNPANELINLDAVEKIAVFEPAAGQISLTAITTAGAQYPLIKVSTRAQMDAAVKALIDRIDGGARFFSFNAYAADMLPQDGAVKWDDIIKAPEPAEVNPEGERLAAKTDIIKCDYPRSATGVIICQDGEAIEYPGAWNEIYLEATNERGEVAILLDTAKESNPVCLGYYWTKEAPRIFRDLRAAVENCDPAILMPKDDTDDLFNYRLEE